MSERIEYMSNLVSYDYADSICRITLDDGKVNSISSAMVKALNQALDQAEKDHGVVLLAGRPGIFSAGFDLKERARGPEDAANLRRSGALLAERLFSFPKPVVIACTGHAIAMGSFLLLTATSRVGADGAYKIGANEVAIGMSVPPFAVELSRFRLANNYLTRALTTAEIFSPTQAHMAGFLDQVCDPRNVVEEAHKIALQLAAQNAEGYLKTTQLLRAPTLNAIRKQLELLDSN